MENQKIKGIVIKSLDYKETSKIVYLYTPKGLLSIKAIGALKPKNTRLGFITTLNYLEVITTDSAFSSLVDYSIINSFEHLKNDLKANLFAMFLLEIVNQIPNDNDHEKIFNFFLRIIEEFDKGVNPLLLTNIFMIKILGVFGVAPTLKKCVICGNPMIDCFSIKDGGALCQNHKHLNTYDHSYLEMITSIYFFDDKSKKYELFKDYDLIKLFNMVIAYYESNVNIYLHGLNTLIF